MLSVLSEILQKYADEKIELCSPEIQWDELGGRREDTIVIHNSLGSHQNIYIFRSEKFNTLVFGNWSRHFSVEDSGTRQLLEMLDLIINHQACVYTVYSRTAIYSALCWQDLVCFSSDSRSRLNHILENEQFLRDAADSAVKTMTLTWDSPHQDL